MTDPLDPSRFDPTRTSPQLQDLVAGLEASLPRPQALSRTSEAAVQARREWTSVCRWRYCCEETRRVCA